MVGAARRLAQTGRLRDALASLDQITMTDEQKPSADRLRADIQRQLLAASQIGGDLPVDAPRTALPWLEDAVVGPAR